MPATKTVQLDVYEDYASAAEKKAAQSGAQRGVPTGKSRGYIFVYRGEFSGNGEANAIASYRDVEPGDDDPKDELGFTNISVEHLRKRCRKVSGCHLPPKWKACWDYYRKDDEE